MEQNLKLKEIKLFAGMPAEVLLWLSDKVDWKEFRKGEYLFYEGDEGDRVFAIVSGRVKIVKEFASGKNAILGLFGRGSLVAEVAAIDQMPYPASAVALENSTVGSIPADVFRESLTKAPDAAIRLMAQMAAKMRQLTDNLGSLSTQKVEKRLARFLTKFSGDIGVVTGAEVTLILPMTRKDLAEVIGTSFEVVERALKKMKEAKIISIEGKKITIHNPEELAAIWEE